MKCVKNLENIDKYPHALNGLRRRVAELVDRLENPFSAITLNNSQPKICKK